MTRQGRTTVTGLILNEEATFTLDELAQACAVHLDSIVELVKEGVVEPSITGQRWEFAGPALTRARSAVRLQNDLNLNPAGAALALDLLEELESLRTRLRALGELP